MLLYYNSFPYYIYPNYYTVQLMPHYIAPPLRHLAIGPTGENGSSFPTININRFEASVKQMQKIMQQTRLLIDKIASSDQFAKDLMNAAQHSNNETVEQLIKSVGITIEFKTKYTPDGIQIILIEKDCCSLTLLLEW